MSQILDDGRVIAFGQSLDEIERMFDLEAIDIPIRIARKGIDKSLKTGNLSLEFDSRKLKRIQFEGEYDFKNPPTPYPESWKNFPVIGATRISGRMSREEFLTYLKAWEERAKTMGAERTEAGDDLAANQYAVVVMQENIMDFYTDMIVVNMGPSRRAGGGGLWCDGWILFFATEADHQKNGIEVGRFKSLSAFRDEFNTVARRISEPPRI